MESSSLGTGDQIQSLCLYKINKTCHQKFQTELHNVKELRVVLDLNTEENF